MNKHCIGCVLHHNAGHPKDSPYARKYNDWCCKNGKPASESIGHCKLHNQKRIEEQK